MTHKPDAVEIRDNRQLMKERSREVCRVCSSPDVHVGHYGEPTIKCIGYLRDECNRDTAELDALRNIIAFYGIEIMPDGSFTSPRITQNEVDVKELREFVGAIYSIGMDECQGYWDQEDGAFVLTEDDGDVLATGTDPFDAWQKLQGESK